MHVLHMTDANVIVVKAVLLIVYDAASDCPA